MFFYLFLCHHFFFFVHFAFCFLPAFNYDFRINLRWSLTYLNTRAFITKGPFTKGCLFLFLFRGGSSALRRTPASIARKVTTQNSVTHTNIHPRTRSSAVGYTLAYTHTYTTPIGLQPFLEFSTSHHNYRTPVTVYTAASVFCVALATQSVLLYFFFPLAISLFLFFFLRAPFFLIIIILLPKLFYSIFASLLVFFSSSNSIERNNDGNRVVVFPSSFLCFRHIRKSLRLHNRKKKDR